MKTMEEAFQLLMKQVSMLDDPDKFKDSIIEIQVNAYCDGYCEGHRDGMEKICECEKSEATS